MNEPSRWAVGGLLEDLETVGRAVRVEGAATDLPAAVGGGREAQRGEVDPGGDGRRAAVLAGDVRPHEDRRVGELGDEGLALLLGEVSDNDRGRQGRR